MSLLHFVLTPLSSFEGIFAFGGLTHIFALESGDTFLDFLECLRWMYIELANVLVLNKANPEINGTVLVGFPEW